MDNDIAQQHKSIKQYKLLLERHDLLKEYLLRPLREARERSGTSFITSDDLKKCQVLPGKLWSQMQAAYHKSEKDLATLEAAMRPHTNIEWTNGVPSLKV